MQERRRVLVVTSVALFFSVLVWFNYSAVLPLIVEEWGLSGTEAGIVFGALQAGYLVAIVPAGWLADRYSPRWVIAVGATTDRLRTGTRPWRLRRGVSDTCRRCVPRIAVSRCARVVRTI